MFSFSFTCWRLKWSGLVVRILQFSNNIMRRNFWRWNTKRRFCRWLHYENKVVLCSQKSSSNNCYFSYFDWQKEIEELRCNLASISSTPDDGAQKLKQEYLQKLNALEAQVNLLSAISLASVGYWLSLTHYLFARSLSWRRNKMPRLNSWDKSRKVMRLQNGSKMRSRESKLKRCNDLVDFICSKK